MRCEHRMLVVCALGAMMTAGCTEPSKGGDEALARQVAALLVDACPVAAPGDEAARALCAARLSDDKFLPGVMKEPFLWGGQTPGTSYHPEESNMNRFNVFVWRRMYLSLLMFPGDLSVETTAD